MLQSRLIHTRESKLFESVHDSPTTLQIPSVNESSLPDTLQPNRITPSYVEARVCAARPVVGEVSVYLDVYQGECAGVIRRSSLEFVLRQRQRVFVHTFNSNETPGLNCP